MPLRPGAVTQGKIDLTRSVWERLMEYPLAAANTYTQEGSCMIFTTETGNNNEVMDISGGIAKEKFAGLAMSDYRRITDFVAVEATTIPSVAAYTYTCEKASQVTAATYYIVDGSGNVYTNDGEGVAPVLTRHYGTASGVITFVAANAGTAITVRYTYTPTTTELQSRFHERPVVDQAQTLLSQVSVAVGFCRMYTTMYNTANTWTVGARAYTGASGKFTTDNTAVQIAARVISIPSTTDVYLGVEYNVNPGATQW